MIRGRASAGGGNLSKGALPSFSVPGVSASRGRDDERGIYRGCLRLVLPVIGMQAAGLGPGEDLFAEDGDVAGGVDADPDLTLVDVNDLDRDAEVGQDDLLSHAAGEDKHGCQS